MTDEHKAPPNGGAFFYARTLGHPGCALEQLMHTEQVVLPKDMLDAVMRVRRMGNIALMEELEKLEPDLAELVMEEHSAIYAALSNAGVSAKASRHISRQVQWLVLIVTIAARQAYRRSCNARERGSDSTEVQASPVTGQSPE